jgi:hypothetical protein
VSATFDDADVFKNVDPASGRVPALVRGSLRDVRADEPLAIAVNGVIGATAPAYADGDTVKFAGMVDGARFRPGSNDVAIYRIVRNNSGRP